MSVKERVAPASLFDPAVQACPYQHYKWLHDEAPVYWDAEIGAHVISKYETIRALALDTETFSNLGMLTAPARSSAAKQVDAIMDTTWRSVPLLVANDPPSHTKYRRISNTILSMQRMKAARPLAEMTIKRYLDPFLAKGGGEFIHEVAAPVPVAIICEMLGIPEAMQHKCREWSDALMDSLCGMASAEREVECANLFVERQNYFAAIIERIRKDGGPEDQMLTGVALARTDDGELLSMAEALTFCEQLLVAGGETTTDSMGLGMRQLAERPELLAALRDNEARVETFVEEILRLYAPPQGAFRIVTRDTEIEGVPIKAGGKIMLRWGAGNRDEDVFPRSGEIDLSRANARNHLTFGFGIHMCQGAPLARIELAILFAEVAKRVRTLSIDASEGGAVNKKTVMNMGLVSLPLHIELL
ncbi:MAG: cytochrome P450 [Caulobacterales bacterium]